MIGTWRQFEEQVRNRGVGLLDRLDEFPDAVLVGGCQRSGTTMLAKVLSESEGIEEFHLGAADACLDAGLILSGLEPAPLPHRRYCFQTTHVDERYREYLQHDGRFHLVWCLRNPRSVVYSLVYNWSRWALRTTYARCGAEEFHPAGAAKWLHDLLGNRGVSRLRKACMIYVAKVSQLFELESELNCQSFTVIEYDDLVRNKDVLLPRLYARLGLSYRNEYASKISPSSLAKADRLTDRERTIIGALCDPIYEAAKGRVNLTSTMLESARASEWRN